jgi:uncharacterized membrane protein
MPYQPSPSRLEAFSDGVIAVIITIMVLDFKVPKDPGVDGLVSVLPTLLVYLLSFVFVGIYWINHHHLVDRLKRVDHTVLWANLGLLFWLSITPFVTANMVDKHLDSLSVAVYLCSLLVTGAAFSVLQWAIRRQIKRSGQAHDPEEAALHFAEQRKGYISIGLYLIGTLLAFQGPLLGLGCAAIVAVMWIIPTIGIHEHSSAGAG